jgi:protein tyrosine/serine phosphatase
VSADGRAQRLLRWEACLNARDVGGYPTRDGGQTRWRALIRADTLCRLTPAGRAALAAYGVRTVIDLRFPSEVALAPHPFATPPAPAAGGDGPRYLNIPVSSGRDPALDAEVAAAFQACRTREEGYCVELDFSRTGFARIAAAVARAPAGGVVVHCHAGKDRTGLAVAVLLALVGVPDEVIADDYALSAACLKELYERQLAEDAPADPAERARMEEEMSARPATMLAALAHLRSRHGGAEAYLLAGGATPDELALLRARLVTAAVTGAA